MRVTFESYGPERFSVLRQYIGTLLWKWRKVMGLLAMLVLQLGSAYGLHLAARHGVQNWGIVANVLLTSGLVLYFVSGKYERLVEAIMYGRLRKKWKNVRVMYAEDEHGFRGVGWSYPREPTLLLHAPVMRYSSPSMGRVEGIPDQLAVSFNNAYLGRPDDDKDEEVTGHWSELEVTPVQIGKGSHMNCVGFPRTLVTRGRVPRREKPSPAGTA